MKPATIFFRVPLLWSTSIRAVLQHPWQFALSVLGVALGVAIVIAIDLANTSARRAFELSADGVAGRTTHVIAPSSLSNGSGFADSVYRYLLVEHGVKPLAPVVEGDILLADAASNGASAPSKARHTFHVLGVDVFAERPFRSYLGNLSDVRFGGDAVDVTKLISQPNAGFISSETAQALGFKLGDTLRLALGGVAKPLVVAGLLTPRDDRSRKALASLIITDIGTAQHLLNMHGLLSRIDCILPHGVSDEQAVERLAKLLPNGLELARSKARPQRIADMARAFDLNLTALSLLALIVGMFIIYNTMTFAVVQRRLHIGILRAMGVTRREVFGLVLGEAFVIGFAGTLVGVVLGLVLGKGLVRLVSQTINDLYFTVSVSELAVPPLVLAKGIVLGIVASLVAALIPAREATHAPPKAVLSRSLLETRLRAVVPRLTWLGVASILLGSVILLIPSDNIFVSYGGLLPVLAGCALLVPAATLVVIAIVQPVMKRLLGVLGSMAARNVVASLSRTAIAIAALMVAVSATVGVGVMVQSFRQTVVEWLSYTLNADIYISTPSLIARRADAPIDAALATELMRTNGVAECTTFRTVLVQVTHPTSRLAQVMAIGMTPRAYERFHFKDAQPDVWRRFHAGEVIVSEAFAFHNGVEIGSLITLQTDAGAHQFRIAGVYYEYASDLGIVFMPRETYNRYWSDRSISGISIFAASGVSPDELATQLRSTAIGRQELSIRSNRALLQQSLEVFDRTFAITDVLRLLTVLVSFVGVLSALMALQLERTRELGVLRAVGLTPSELWKLITLQTGVMGLIAGLLAIPVGLALAYVLIFVINQRSFGWTLQVHIRPEILLQAVVLAVVAAVVAGLYPAWKMARTSPAEALREE
jgi:putative ABC transport system permease protein